MVGTIIAKGLPVERRVCHQAPGPGSGITPAVAVSISACIAVPVAASIAIALLGSAVVVAAGILGVVAELGIAGRVLIAIAKAVIALPAGMSVPIPVSGATGDGQPARGCPGFARYGQTRPACPPRQRQAASA